MMEIFSMKKIENEFKENLLDDEILSKKK